MKRSFSCWWSLIYLSRKRKRKGRRECYKLFSSFRVIKILPYLGVKTLSFFFHLILWSICMDSMNSFMLWIYTMPHGLHVECEGGVEVHFFRTFIQLFQHHLWGKLSHWISFPPWHFSQELFECNSVRLCQNSPYSSIALSACSYSIGTLSFFFF